MCSGMGCAEGQSPSQRGLLSVRLPLTGKGGCSRVLRQGVYGGPKPVPEGLSVPLIALPLTGKGRLP